MKKLVISMIAVVSAIIMCFALAGCSKDVKGNTYVFDDVKVTVSDDSSVTQEEIDEEIAWVKETFKEASVKFNDDGTYEMNVGEGQSQKGNYKQDGDKVYLNDQTESYFKVDGSKIIMEESDDGVTMSIVFKKK